MKGIEISSAHIFCFRIHIFSECVLTQQGISDRFGQINFLPRLTFYISIIIKNTFTFTFRRRFYPKRLTIGEYMKRYILKRQTDRGSACNTKSQALFK